MLIKSPMIRSLFASPKGANGSGPDHDHAENGMAGAPAHTPRAEALQRLEHDLHEQIQSLLAIESELQARRIEQASMEQTLAAREQELTDLRAKLADTVGARDSARLELEKSLAELKDSRRTGDSARQRGDAEAATAAQLRSTVDALQAKYDKIKELEDAQTEQLVSYRDALVGLEEAVAERDEVLDSKSTELSALATALNQIERSAAEMRGRNAELESTNGKLQAIATEANRTVERLTGDLHRAQTHSERLSQAVTEKEGAERALRAEVEAGEAEVADLNRRLADLQAALEATKAELMSAAEARELNAALDRERAKAAGLFADLNEREGRIGELKRALEDAQSDVEAAEASALETEAKLEAMEAENEKAISALKREWDGVAEENDRINRSLEDKDSMADMLRLEIEQLREFRNGADNEIDALKRIIEELELELRNKRMVIASLEREGGRRASMDTTQTMELMGSDSLPSDETMAMTRPRMLVTQGQSKTRYPLNKPTIVLGRSSDCDIRIGGTHTSRHHARIVNGVDGSTIEDLDSINGLLVNSENVKSRVLCDGDTIQIGKNMFKFSDPAASRVMEEQAH